MIKFTEDVELDVVFNEIEGDEKLPEATLFVLDEKNKILERQDICHLSKVTLPAKALNKAKKVLITRQIKKLDDNSLETAQSFSRRQIMQLSLDKQAIDLSRRRWLRWIPTFKVCVSGKVRKCFWWPLIQRLQTVSLPIRREMLTITAKPSLIAEATSLAAIDTSFEFFSPFRKCRPVCEGLVEVYERICCRRIVITPPLIEELCRILKEKLIEIPERPFPDPEIGPLTGPEPDPIPFELQPLFNYGTVDEVHINAAEDLRTLSKLPLPEAENYILARPYLIHIIENCGTPVLRGVTTLGENGEFNLCYSASPILVLPGLKQCRREVAFKVIQQTDSGPRVIYDGVSANAWFSPNDNDITLTTYDPKAIACEPTTPVPGPGGAYVALARIGTGTDSVHLDSPDQSSDYEVSGPIHATAGLAFPEANLNLAKGKKKSELGEFTTAIRLFKAMASTKAEYYRISVAQANSAGQAIESTRQYLDRAISWYYNDPVFSGGSHCQKTHYAIDQTYNPTFHNSYNKLIPTDASWRDNQYHGFVDTREFANTRHLITIQVYDGTFVWSPLGWG